MQKENTRCAIHQMEVIYGAEWISASQASTMVQASKFAKIKQMPDVRLNAYSRTSGMF
jgi:hypothetical protein